MGQPCGDGGNSTITNQNETDIPSPITAGSLTASASVVYAVAVGA